MICPNCKKENTENIKWCCYCGSLLELSPLEFKLDEPINSYEPEQSRQTSSLKEFKPQKYNSKKRSQKRKNKRRNHRRSMRTLLWVVFVLSVLVTIFAACMYFSPTFNHFSYQILWNIENIMQNIQFR